MIVKVSAVAAGSCHHGRPFASVRRTLRPGVKPGFVASVAVACSLGMLTTVWAERSVTLAWNPSTDPSAIGYRIHVRAENATSATPINVVGLTKVTLPGLMEGLRYTFTVTSYNAAGVESPPSNEAEYLVPVPLHLLPGTTASATKLLQFPMAPGHWYELQASENMQTWTTIWQSSIASTYAWTDYTDPQSNALNTRFYRLKVH